MTDSNSDSLPFDDILNPQTTNQNEKAMFNEIDIFGDSPVDESGEEFDPSFPSIEEYDKKTRIRILFLTSLPFLLQPLSTTMAVPSFNDIQTNLQTSYTLVALTVAGYNLMAGIFPMFYGPVSDQYGRKLIWYVTLPAFILFAALSGFSFNIWMLIIFRSLMGACTCASVIVGAGIIADIFPTETQGKAFGAQQFPLLLAPIIGSPLGGLLTGWFGWRSVNFFLAIIGIPLAIIVFMLIPETLVRKEKKISPVKVLKAMNPWNTIKLLLSPIIGMVAFARAVGFSWMMLMVILTPKILEKFHGMEPWQIGFWNLAFSFGAIVGTMLGGVAVDRGLKKFGPGGRLISANISTLILAFGLVGFGWTIEWNSWVGLVFSIFIGFGVCANRPGFITYAMRELPSKSSAITGSTMMLGMVLSLPLSLVGPSLASLIGVAALFSLGGALVVMFIIPTVIIMGLNIQRDPEEDS